MLSPRAPAALRCIAGNEGLEKVIRGCGADATGSPVEDGRGSKRGGRVVTGQCRTALPAVFYFFLDVSSLSMAEVCFMPAFSLFFSPG